MRLAVLPGRLVEWWEYSDKSKGGVIYSPNFLVKTSVGLKTHVYSRKELIHDLQREKRMEKAKEPKPNNANGRVPSCTSHVSSHPNYLSSS